MAAAVDVGYIAGHLGLDQPVITSLTTEPTLDLITQLLQAVANKAHEFDTLYAAKLQSDIELENAVRGSESRSQASREITEKALKDLEEARQKLKEEETKRQAVENELQTLRTKGTGHDAELKALNDKIETLQSTNRANLSVIESTNKRDQTLTDEMTKQHQKNVELSREIKTLKQSEQNAKGQLSSAKYREDALQQQLDLARKNSDWLETELKTKSDEALKYRKEKGARIAQLQRQNEDAKADMEALQRGEKALRDRLNTMQAKADEALVKLQKQEGSFATTVESYKQEQENQRRLVDMSDQLSKKHQERVQDLETEKARLRDNYEGELHRVRVELEQERQASSEIEEKNSQLESQIEELKTRADNASTPAQPQTPRANGSSFAPRAASPFATPGAFATPGSTRSKSAMTTTQALDQVYHLKDELVKERRKNQKLREDIDDIMTALEAKGPEFQELQSENEMLRTEITRMSELSQQSFEERDNSRRAARKAENALSSAQSEAKILRLQLRDLGTQIQMLVFNAYAMEKGMDQLTDNEKIRLEQLARGEITEEALSDMSDTHQFITERLVVFKDVQSLQQKNEENLATIRQLAEQMDSEEAISAKRQAKEDHDRVQKLEQELAHMTEEASSMKGVVDSCKRERDMFRRILQQRGANVDDTAMFSGSFRDSQRLPLASIEAGDQVEGLNEALRKLQTEYDNYRDAQEGVRKDIRTQLDNLTTDKNSLQTDKIKLQGEVKLESERREMLQNNYVALQTENGELQKRNQSLSETAAKQDIRTQQVAEELIEARGLLDSMRNETANLKAEKKLRNEIHDRMRADNEALIEEKNRLNNILSTQQSLENERIMVESEARRKAQARVETLERELSDTQKRLTHESEETKKLQLRKEYETKEAQKRVDELMASLSQLREELVSVKTSRDHLQARVSELTVELRNAEERVGRLQPRPTPRPGADANQKQQELESEIEDLNNEISEVKRELDLAKHHLENANAKADQYRELSQSNEEALEDIRGSQEQYQREMETLVEERSAKVLELVQRIDDMSSELSRSNSELSSLRDSQGEVARRYQDEKVILEEELTRLKEDSARHVEAARFHQQDLRSQAEIATKAQQDYETELVKHAEAAKLVQQLRTEYNALKSETASLRAEAESAKVTLAQSEGSWVDQRQRLEQEIGELKTRREDINAQNKLLHEQMNTLSSQVSSLQRCRATNDEDENDEAMSPVAMDHVSEGLRELNTYLRREKEILEVQYDMKTQEAKRLQQQLEYAQSQLDETRLKLDQERSLAADGGRTSMAHQDLMEKLNELNIYRESSMTLRNENNRLKDVVTEKTSRIEEMEAKIQPLEAEIDSLNTTKSYLEDEIKQIQEDRDRWQKRTEGILTKYGRVDPAEMDGLKEKVETLEAENNTLKEAEQPLKEKVTELESTLETERTNWTNTRARLAEQFKERSRKLTGDKNEALQRSNQLQEELVKATGERDTALKDAEEFISQKSQFETQIQQFQKQVEELQQQAKTTQDPDAMDISPADARPADLSASALVVAQLEQQLADAQKSLEATNAQKLGAEQQLESLRSEMQAAVSERDETIRQLQEATATQEEPQGEAQEPTEQAEKTEQTEQTERAEKTGQTPATVESVEVTAVPITGTAGPLTDEERTVLEQRIAELEEQIAELERKAAEAEAKITQTIKERSDRMKDALNTKLKESRAKLDEEYKQKEETLKQTEEDLKLKLAQEKQIWLAENASSAPAASDKPPATPSKVGSNQVPNTPAAVPFDLTQLDDAAVRLFLSTNLTVKAIVAANIKKKVEAESAKALSELDQRIAAARDQAQMLESKKSTLRINMAENKLRNANAKIKVVEVAAEETPQKPVVEVWEVAKTAMGQPPTPAAPKPTPAKQPSTPGPAATPSTPAPKAAVPDQAPATGAPVAAVSQTQNASAPAATPVPANPFAVSANETSSAVNPFKAPVATDTESTTTTAKPLQQQQPQGPRTGIPLPRGGGRGGRGGTYVPPGRAASSTHESSLPHLSGGRGGRGGGRGGRGGMNPGVQEFQPGNKRTRGDADGGGGAKRARGSH